MLTSSTGAKETDLGKVITIAAALSAVGGGLIHLNQIPSHLDVPLIAGSFAIMGASQWAFALSILARPSRTILILGGALHAVIAAVWIVSRTIGLGFVSGAESPLDVGVPDVVANTFSVAVVAAAVIGTALSRATRPVVLPSTVGTRINGVVLACVIFLTVPALLAPHDHAHHAPTSHTSETSHSHDHASTRSNETPEHDHGEVTPGPLP